MKLIRDIQDNKVSLFDDNDKILLGMNFCADEFGIFLYDNISISREDNIDLYDNLDSLLHNRYVFDNKLSM